MKDGDEGATEKGREWLLLIRDSLNLPSVMSEHSSRVIIAGRLAALMEDRTDPSDASRELGAKLLQVILRLGAQGDLDDALVANDAEMVLSLRVAGIGGAERDIGRRVTGLADIAGARGDVRAAASAVQNLLTPIALTSADVEKASRA
jgi:hypothetical protein